MTERIAKDTIIKALAVFHCPVSGDELVVNWDEIALSSTAQDFSKCYLSVPCKCNLHHHLIEIKSQ